MATLGELRSALFPFAVPGRPVAADEAAREVTWVRVLKARSPAFDALDPGDLVLVPVDALDGAAGDSQAANALVEQLLAAPVAAAVLCGEPGGAAAAAALEGVSAAASAAGLVTFRLTPADVVALERRAIAFLVNQRAELERRASELDAQLSRLALAGAGVEALAAAIAAFLGRAVAIEGPAGDPIAVHAPADVPAAGAAAARYLSRNLGSVAALRIIIPAAPGERGTGGRLLLLGDEAATELDRVAGDRAAALLGLELARAAAVGQALDEARRGEALPVDGPPWVVLMARQGAAPGAPDEDSLVARERVRAGLRSIASGRRLLLRGSAASVELRMVAVAPPDDPRGFLIAGRIAEYLGRTVGISRPFTDAAGRSAAESSARAALDAATQLPAPPPVAGADHVPVYHLLAGLRGVPDGARLSAALLAPLLEERPGVQQGRLETLRAYLEAGAVGEAATALGVHRNTIAYRLEAIQKATGWDLADRDLRVALMVALRLRTGAQEA